MTFFGRFTLKLLVRDSLTQTTHLTRNYSHILDFRFVNQVSFISALVLGCL